MMGDLTTVANVAAWLGQSNVTAANTPLIQRLITMASRFILGEINRQDLTYHQVTEIRDGWGGNVLILQEYPALAMVSLYVQGNQILPVPAPYPAGSGPQPPVYVVPNLGVFGNGYQLDPWSGEDSSSVQRVTLLGGIFPRIKNSIQVTYMAGYYVPAEAWKVPAGTQPQIQPYRQLAEDQGVVYAETLVALTFVPPIAPGTPPELSLGQYSADQTTGLYTFSEADADALLSGSYSYTPEDLAQACIELVGERYSAKSRIGIVSQSLGGQETVSYSQKDMGAFIESLISPYRKSIPL